MLKASSSIYAARQICDAYVFFCIFHLSSTIKFWLIHLAVQKMRSMRIKMFLEWIWINESQFNFLS